MPKTFTWLHITDLHCGIAEQEWIWPTIREAFYQDLESLYQRTGPWSVVVFSGDLTKSGRSIEFEALTRHLEDLWTFFGTRLKTTPLLFAIPGNHDLERPDPSLPTAKLFRDNYWRDEEIRTEFWSTRTSPYRDLVTTAFAEFLRWRDNLTLPIVESLPGVMPGDVSAVVQQDGIQVGFIGLNTALVQLSEGDYEHKLDVHATQLTGVAKGDLPRWCASNTANLLVTHHPPEWLHPRSLGMFRQQIDSPGRFVAHLCGHLHDNVARSVSEGGATPRRLLQSRSLYGLKYFKKKGRDVQRQHGYGVGQLSIGEDGPTVLRLWPRKNVTNQSGQLRIVPDYDFELDEATGAAEWVLARPSVVETATVPTQASTEVAAGPIDDVGETRDILGDPFDVETARAALASVPRWDSRLLVQHTSIRGAERTIARDALISRRAIWVGADWGLGKDAFIRSLVSDSTVGAPELFRINCENVTSYDGLIEAAATQLTMAFQQFLILVSRLLPVYLLFDNVPDELCSGQEGIHLEEAAEATRDLCPRMALIFTARRLPTESRFPGVELRPLDEAECAKYIEAHPEGGSSLLSGRALEQIFALSEGLPMHLDRILSELRTLSIDEVAAVESDERDEVPLAEPVPSSLSKAVLELQGSSDKYRRRSWQLLRLLTVLAYGETFRAIRKFDPNEPFYIQNVQELRDLGLLDAIPMSTRAAQLESGDTQNRIDISSEKLLIVPRQVRDYVRRSLGEEERHQIAARALELYFGTEWRERPRIPTVVGTDNPSSAADGPGNAHLVAFSVMRHALLSGDDLTFTRAFALEEHYFGSLRAADRFRDCARAAGEAFELLEDKSRLPEAARAGASYGASLRMTASDAARVVTILEKALQYSEKAFGNEWFAQVWINLALAHEGLKDYAAAGQAASQVEKFAKKTSGLFFQAQAIKVQCEVKGAIGTPETVGALVELEANARRRGHEIVANNIALSLARLEGQEGEQRKKLLERVLGSKQDAFNRINAMLVKAEDALSQSRPGDVSPKERRFLGQAYSYLYTQRLPSFDRCHRILWQLNTLEKKVPVLLRLFRYSSFLWRIFGRKKEERKYLTELDVIVPQAGVVGEGLQEEAAYLQVRRNEASRET